VSIVAREYTVNIGNAAQIVSTNAAQLLSSAIMHNARLAPYKLCTRLFVVRDLLSLQLASNGMQPLGCDGLTVAEVDFAHLPF
jgi:hypothetical protein